MSFKDAVNMEKCELSDAKVFRHIRKTGMFIVISVSQLSNVLRGNPAFGPPLNDSVVQRIFNFLLFIGIKSYKFKQA